MLCSFYVLTPRPCKVNKSLHYSSCLVPPAFLHPWLESAQDPVVSVTSDNFDSMVINNDKAPALGEDACSDWAVPQSANFILSCLTCKSI